MHKKLFSTTILLLACAALSFGQGENYFSGKGGAGESIAVLIPEGRGLSENESYIPTLVQGVLVGDLTKFSAMKVIDRANLEKVIAEGEKDFYADENNFVQLGSIIDVRYVLNGTLQKTGSGFSLQLKITEAASGATKAAYSSHVQAAELDNLGAVNKASSDLLSQLGITLTRAGNDTLLAAAQSNNIAAETALAKGITAQRSGTVVEALNYYYEASDSDPKRTEAASRLAGLSTRISSGNLGENVRSEIQQRNAWQKLLDEAAAYYKDHPFFDLVYNKKPQQGKINFDTETVDISFNIWIVPNARFYALKEIVTALHKTGKANEWGVSDGIRNFILTVDNPSGGSFSNEFFVEAELLDDTGNTIGLAETYVESSWPSVKGYRSPFYHSLVIKSESQLRFKVNANQISDTMTVTFTGAKYSAHDSRKDRTAPNILSNIKILQTNKTFQDYFGTIDFQRKKITVEHNYAGYSSRVRWMD